jgi:uncharacterized repeat protein (TIGR01451 family)
LTAPDGGPFDYFGTTVSISGDTIVVGAPNHTTAPELRPGAVYVYVRSGVTWTFQAELSASSPFTGPPLETFGGAVAVSGDTLVASAVAGFNSPNPNPGSALVFVRSGGLWTLQQEVFAGDGAATDQFGTALALAGDTLLVGAPGRTGGPAESPATRAAYVFDRAATSWSLSAKLYSDAADDQFGGAVALAGDTAVVGAYADFRSGLMARGAAHVWVRDTGGWSAQAQLARRGLAPGDAYGFAVATDGRYVAAGAPDVRGTGMGAYEGRVYVIDSGAGEPTSTAIVPDARAPIAPGTTSVVVNVSGQSGTPAGSVTISGSNGAACIASLAPAGPGSASGSCDLAFGQPGLYWLDAAFAGSESFRASSGTGLQPVQGSADLAIAISNNSDFLHGGGNTTYQIVVTNLGSTTAFSAEVDDVLPAGLSNGSWTCTAIDGGVCPASGSGDLSALVTLPVGAEAHFVLSADVSSASESPIIDTATVSPSVPGTDPVLGNNSASDGPDQRGIFRDGFEG